MVQREFRAADQSSCGGEGKYKITAGRLLGRNSMLSRILNEIYLILLLTLS
jgi:hypothetical protein